MLLPPGRLSPSLALSQVARTGLPERMRSVTPVLVDLSLVKGLHQPPVPRCGPVSLTLLLYLHSLPFHAARSFKGCLAASY